jgi:hypothetical protein
LQILNRFLFIPCLKLAQGKVIPRDNRYLPETVAVNNRRELLGRSLVFIAIAPKRRACALAIRIVRCVGCNLAMKKFYALPQYFLSLQFPAIKILNPAVDSDPYQHDYRGYDADLFAVFPKKIDQLYDRSVYRIFGNNFLASKLGCSHSPFLAAERM